MHPNRVPKTYVISRRTLESLEQISRHYQTPRDILVEFSIERIMPLIQEERAKHENRKQLLSRLEKLMTEGHSLMEAADAKLDRDDPVFEKILQMYRSIHQGRSDINAIVEKGRKLEEF